MNLDWFNAYSADNRLVVFYEDLVAHPLKVLSRILDFLQVSVSGSTLQCVLDRREGIYKRSKKKLGFEVFNDDMKAFLRRKQRAVIQIMKTPDLDDVSGTDTSDTDDTPNALVQ